MAAAPPLTQQLSETRGRLPHEADRVFLLSSRQMAALAAQRVNNPPAMQKTQEMRAQSLGWEDPLEEEVAAHSSILAWKAPWTEEPGGLQSPGSQRLRYD